MNRPAVLASVADVLLDEATPPTLLHETLETYRDLLLSASGLDLGDADSLSPRHTDQGVAIGATWAALCIDDEFRTHRFIAGLHRAIQDRRAECPGTVHVLYAGCGPFATLALPLMTRFRPDELQFTLLEINEVSCAAVRQLLHELGLNDYVQSVVQTDASTFPVRNPAGVDMLLTETMQYSLVDEMQVPICLNLLPQLPAHVRLIPASIELRLARMEPANAAFVEEDLGHLLTIDRASLLAYVRPEHSTDFPTVRLPIPAAGGLLAIRTIITVYGDQKLLDYESGLTNPEIIGRFPDEEGVPEYIDFTYQVEPCPFLRLAYPVPATSLDTPMRAGS